MSHHNYLIKIKGVIITNAEKIKSEETGELLASALDIALNEKTWKDEICEDLLPAATALREKIQALPHSNYIFTIWECQVTGSGAMAVGWTCNNLAIIDLKMVGDLTKILNEAGFTTEPIQDNQFETYG